MPQLEATTLWREALAMPATLRQTLAKATGFDELAALLGTPDVRRVVATGNGAAYYAAHALWLASLASRDGPDVLALPAGLVAAGRFRWREGDVLLVISSSGELRDVVEALAVGAPRPYGAITAAPGSTIGAGAAARAVVDVASQEALTHTQSYLGNVLVALAVWARVSADRGLATAVEAAPDAVAHALARAPSAAENAAERAESVHAAIALGTGTGWSAALEAALLLKEISRIPAEGQETREGATSGMYALAPGHLALVLAAGADPLLDEAEETCAATGATVVRIEGPAAADARLAPLTTFPGALALAIELGLRAGHDVDSPGWADAYYATARVKKGVTL